MFFVKRQRKLKKSLQIPCILSHNIREKMQQTMSSAQPSTYTVSDSSILPSKRQIGLQQNEMVPRNNDQPISKHRSSSRNHVLQKPSSRCHAPRKTFPRKLHEMLKEVETNGLSHIVSWQPHGMAFVVHKPDVFAREIMPNNFRQTKYSSFLRQLNLYGFQRLYCGPDKGGYYHYAFLRGEELLLDDIIRVRVKGTGVRQPSKKRLEPNFYAMAYPQTPIMPSHVILPTSQIRPGQTPTQAKAFQETPSYDAMYLNTAGLSKLSVGSDSETILDCPTELRQICFDCFDKNLNMDDLDQLPEDDTGWDKLLNTFEEDDNNDTTLTSIPQSRLQLQSKSQSEGQMLRKDQSLNQLLDSICESNDDHDAATPAVALQSHQAFHQIQENLSRQHRRGSSMSLGSFDCTPLDYQDKPKNDESFDPLTASYQVLLSGQKNLPAKKFEKARAA